MNLNKFTIKAQETVQEAVNTARRSGQQAIEPEHLMAATLKVGEQLMNFVCQKMGVNMNVLAQAVNAQIGSLPRVQGGEPYLSRDTNLILDKAEEMAGKARD
ncbi:MAG: type VI secretion system ATPase TssH, partial [Bacteroidaceae bacterium]|nr:type VI secretion system ATPase TssH [Bacteroidaceae bacterium]